MRTLLSIAILFLPVAPAFAQVQDATIPEPDVLALVGIGALAFLFSRRRKK